MARTWYRNQALSRQTTTSTTYADVVGLTFTPQASTDYWLLWSAIFDSSVTTDNSRHRLRDDSAGANLANPNHRAQSTTEKMSVGGIAAWTSGASPGSQTFSIEHQCETAGTTTGTSDAHLIAIKRETGDQYAESTGSSSTTSSTLADKATLTFTPASAGDYLILVSAEINGFVNASPFQARGRCLLDVNGTPYLDTVDGYMTLTTTQYASWAGAVVASFGAGSQTLKIRYASSDNTTTVQIRQARILAIRLDSFPLAATDQDNTRQTTTASSAQVAAGVTLTAQGADYLMLGAGMFDYDTSFAPVWGNLKVDAAGTDRNLYIKRQYGSGAATGSTGARSSFIAFGYGALSAGSRTVNTDWWSNSSNDHAAGVKDAFAGVFLLDTVNADITVPAAILQLSGGPPAAATGGAAIVPLKALALVAGLPTVRCDVLCFAPPVVLSLGPRAPSVAASVQLAVPAAAAALDGQPPALAIDAAIRPGAAAISVAAALPVARADNFLRVPAQMLTLRGLAPARAGPLWRAADENLTIWAQQSPAHALWTPAGA